MEAGEGAEKLVQQTSHTARSGSDTSQKAMKFQWLAQRPHIYPELRWFGKLTCEGEDHPEQPATMPHSNEGKFCLDLDLESLQAEEYLSHIGVDEARSIHTESCVFGSVDAVRRHQDETTFPPSDTRGLHVSDDWYENFLGQHQVPADFWRSNKLY
jgi:hypothetical protein